MPDTRQDKERDKLCARKGQKGLDDMSRQQTALAVNCRLYENKRINIE